MFIYPVNSNGENKMSNQELEITIKIRNKDKQETLVSTTTKEVPDFGDVDKSTFIASLDTLETATLELAKKVSTDIVEHIIGEGSKKKAAEVTLQYTAKGLEVGEYPIEAKFGTVICPSYRIKDGRKVVYNSMSDYYPDVASRESLHTPKLVEISMFTCSNLSYRKAVENLVMWRGEGNVALNPMTLRNQTEKIGRKITTAISVKTEDALSKVGFCGDVAPTLPENTLPSLQLCAMDPKTVESTAERAKIVNYNAEDFEDPTKVFNASVDDICVKAQNSKRPMPEGKEKKKKRVDNTVIHCQSDEGQYTITGDGVYTTLRYLLGYLAFNSLMFSKCIVFFTDGARNIHSEIEKMFSFTSYKILLDWYHLEKRFAEQFSLAFMGSKIRNEQLNIIRPLLWYGKVDAAIGHLQKVDPRLLKPKKEGKDKTILEELIDYLKRVRTCIPNYALRKKLHLRNSSNLGEKANDLVVAARQKKQGMSFSQTGSKMLATVRCACQNGEHGVWAKKNEIPFKPIPQLAKAA
jgi:hypothetical protein